MRTPVGQEAAWRRSELTLAQYESSLPPPNVRNAPDRVLDEWSWRERRWPRSYVTTRSAAAKPSAPAMAPRNNGKTLGIAKSEMFEILIVDHGNPSLKSRIGCWCWMGLGWLISLFFISGQFMINAGNNITYLKSNQNFCNFTTNFTSLAMTPAPVTVNLQWLLTGIQIAIPGVYWGAAILYIIYFDTIKAKFGEKPRLWDRFAFADHISLAVQCVLWGSMAYILNNLLGEKSWNSNVSMSVITVNYLGWVYLAEYVANVAYNADMREKISSRIFVLNGLTADDMYVIFAVIYGMAVLSFAWLMSSMAVPVILMYGQNITIPIGTLYAYGAFLGFMVLRALILLGMTFMTYAWERADFQVHSDPVDAVTGKALVAVALPYSFSRGDFAMLGATASVHLCNFIGGMIAIYGIEDQFPTNYQRVA